MGYIDADAHIRETDLTWTYMSEEESKYRPISVEAEMGAVGNNVSSASPDISRYWLVQDQRANRKDGRSARPRERELFPEGTVELEDVATRLAHMDALGVDVQVLFSTFWIAIAPADPLAERALARSYNRWMAEATAPSEGRLRWVLKPCLQSIQTSLDELSFGARHGAVAVLMKGRELGFDLSAEHYWPIYERAEELGLVMAVHTGTDGLRVPMRSTGRGLYMSMTTVLDGFYTVVNSGLADRFPQLRWGFFEAGAGWVPWLLHNSVRSDQYGLRNESQLDWRNEAAGIMKAKNCYVSAYVDDDLAYLGSLLGNDHLVIGSDWGHYDAGSDLECHRTIVRRGDIDIETRRRIVDRNARELYGIAADFCPTGHLETV